MLNTFLVKKLNFKSIESKWQKFEQSMWIAHVNPIVTDLAVIAIRISLFKFGLTGFSENLFPWLINCISMWSLCSKICNLQKYFWSGQLKLTTAQHIFSTEMDILEELHNIKLYHQLDSYGQAFKKSTVNYFCAVLEAQFSRLSN